MNSGAGECGRRISIATRTSVVAPTTSVGSDVSAMWRATLRASAKKPLFRHVEPKQLRRTIQKYYQPDSGFEAGQHRRRNEIRHKTETQ